MSEPARNLPMGADLYGELLITADDRPTTIRKTIPGLLLAFIASLAAAWLSEHYGVPLILMGLLIGLGLNFVNQDKRLAPGLTFASQTLLRIGIVLIGAKVTLAQFGALGLPAFGALLVIMLSVIAAGILAAKFLKQDMLFGLLAGGATAICGASAALALWSLIGEKRIDQARFTLVLVGIFMMSAMALAFYPAIAGILELSDRQAGFLIGASIHDVAQAIGGGFSYSQAAGEIATIVKLTRVALLAPLVAIFAIWLRAQAKKTGADDVTLGSAVPRFGLPWFIIGFILLVLVNSMFNLPGTLVGYSQDLASWMLLLSVVATAMKSNMSALLTQGWRSFVPVIAATAVAFFMALGAAMLL
ncbi:putative sulfate exporter family transporter [Parasphingorhabdus halotolerans]|uniref:Putative sulfate exporter family transporter n=2 Tax=Parasphingorhabdus halotolerans TaxID=2725558 RepID=A0A6H2DQ58_9SPHN|nr:putative sulfate exporter family transporter [Parasphingorhabdus halotolerans]QJB70789.1 putative sulfate exporter family transporter [Parasphingorhabdus halotolerans]